MRKFILIILNLFFIISSLCSAMRIKLYNMGLSSETSFKITIYTAEQNICNSYSDIYEADDKAFIDSLFLLMGNMVETANVSPDIRAVMQVYYDSYLHETIYFNSKYIVRGDCVYEMNNIILNALYRKFGDLD